MPVNTKQLDKLVLNFEKAASSAKKEIGGELTASQRATKAEFMRAALLSYNIKAPSLEKRFDIKANPGRISYFIQADDAGILIASYGGKANAKGVVAQTLKKGGPEFFAGGFFPSKGSRARVAFKRDGRKRYPIAPVRGPSAAAIVGDANVRREALSKINVRLTAGVETRIKRILNGG